MSRRSLMVDAFTDEDGIDGPLERAERAAERAPRRRRNPLTTTHRDLKAVNLIELDEALAAAEASTTASRAAREHLAEAAAHIAAARR